MDREACHAAVHGVAELDTAEQLNLTEPYCFDYCSQYCQYNLKSGSVTPQVCYFLRLPYTMSFVVSYKFQNYLLQFCEKCYGYFHISCFESIDSFGQCGNLTLLIILIYEDGLSSDLFMQLSVSFINVLQYSEYRSFTS